MMEKAKKTKIIIGLSYLILLTIFVMLFFSKFSIQEITSYDFIRENILYFLELKNSNLFLISIIFLIFTILWVFPFLVFCSPIALLGGFIFGCLCYSPIVPIVMERSNVRASSPTVCVAEMWTLISITI